MRLQECLATLTLTAREALQNRRKLVIDELKRIDPIEQLARGLVMATDLRKSKLPPDVRSLLDRLVAAGGVLSDAGRDPGAELLLDLGVAYRYRDAVPTSPSRSGKRLALDTLVLPSAFLVQAPAAQGEDPRSLRLLLGRLDSDLVSAMLKSITGKPSHLQGALALQEVWEDLNRPDYIQQQIALLSSQEARLLDAIERAGSEVTPEELLALDQTPGLYKSGSGIAVPKRGAPYLLQRRGLLFAVGADRFVLPSEVSALVGAARARDRAEKRAHLSSKFAVEDHAPHRARYATSPSVHASALLTLCATWDSPIRSDVAHPRALIRRGAELLGIPEHDATLLFALLRTSGLGRLTDVDAGAPASLARVRALDVDQFVLEAYRRGGSWDETQIIAEVQRAGSDVGRSAAAVLRAMLFDGLEAFASNQWVPVEMLLQYIKQDPRMAGAQRIHERARKGRESHFVQTCEEALRAMVLQTLPALGLLDCAEDASVVRFVSSNARISSAKSQTKVSLSRTTLEVPASCPLHAMIAFGQMAELDGVDVTRGMVRFQVGAGAIAMARVRALASDQVAELLAGIGVNAPYRGAIEQFVDALASQQVLQLVATSGALRVDSETERRAILADSQLRKNFLDVDAGGWLLLRSDADFVRVGQRLQRLGYRTIQSDQPDSAQENPSPRASNDS
ncbi:MAG: hypothetical protein Q8Q09_12085 [Deltaproteobacteria bacterium]|nr:hypothetical protein [Deltaproteobacteria bacterium]